MSNSEVVRIAAVEICIAEMFSCMSESEQQKIKSDLESKIAKSTVLLDKEIFECALGVIKPVI